MRSMSPSCPPCRQTGFMLMCSCYVIKVDGGGRSVLFAGFPSIKGSTNSLYIFFLNHMAAWLWAQSSYLCHEEGPSVLRPYGLHSYSTMCREPRRRADAVSRILHAAIYRAPWACHACRRAAYSFCTTLLGAIAALSLYLHSKTRERVLRAVAAVAGRDWRVRFDGPVFSFTFSSKSARADVLPDIWKIPGGEDLVLLSSSFTRLSRTCWRLGRCTS